MKAKHLVTLCLLAGFLAGFGLWGLLRTPGDVSQAERRPLAQWPELTVSGFLSGQYAGKLEHAAADQFPLREQFRTAYPHRPEEDLLLADTSFRAPTIKYVRERAKAGGKVYSYLFDQDFPLMGKSTPWHCADIPFVFHNTELVPVCAFEGAKQLEAEIFGAVMQFARTGAPGWAASTEDVEQTMLFGPQSRLVQNHDHALIEALAPFTDLRMKKATRAGGQIQH